MTSIDILSGDRRVAPGELTYDDRGLLPVIVQDLGSGAVLMLAWANLEAVERTLATREAHFYSRSRQQLWRKGETSGNVLAVKEVLADCDRDALLVRALAAGPTCHLGSRSCFEPNAAAAELGWLRRVIVSRRDATPEQSYTSRLLHAGVERIAQKVGEEGVEVAISAATLSLRETAEGRSALVGEVADLLYHLLVLLEATELEPEEVIGELVSRHFGVGSAGSSEGAA